MSVYRLIIVTSFICASSCSLSMEPKKKLSKENLKKQLTRLHVPFFFHPASKDSLADDDTTPLHNALLNKNFDAAQQFLLDPAIEVNYRNKWGNTPLHCVAFMGYQEGLDLLLNNEHVDASLVNDEGDMPHQCLNRNTLEYKKMLNRLCANAIQHIGKYTLANYFSVDSLSPRTPRRLLNCTDPDNTTPLIWAVASNQPTTVIETFLSYDSIDLNVSDYLFGTALHYAAYLGKIDILTLLLSDHRVNAALKNTLEQCAHDCIDKKESPDHETTCNSLFARAWLNAAVDQVTFATIISKRLEECTAEYKLTPLTIDDIIATIKERKEKENKHQASSLPEDSLPPYATDLFLSSMIQCNYTIYWLQKDKTLALSALNFTSPDDPTRLIKAVQNQNIRYVKKILHDDIDVNRQDESGFTALHYAAQLKNAIMIATLLQDPRTQASLKNNDEKAPRELIEGSAQEDIVLRNFLFARVSLETIIASMCLLIKKAYVDQYTTKQITQDSTCITVVVDEIRYTFSRDAELQNTYQPLPIGAQLPSYADDTFIAAMILLRLYNK